MLRYGRSMGATAPGDVANDNATRTPPQYRV